LRATADILLAQSRALDRQAAATAQAQQQAFQATLQALQLAQAQAQATATAQAQSLSLAQTQAAASATAQALQEAQLARRQRQQRQEAQAWMVTLISLAFLLGLAGISLRLLWQAGQGWLAWQERRQRLIESRAGTLLLLPEGPPLKVQVIQPACPQGVDEEGALLTDTEPIPYSLNGELVGFLHRQPSLAEPQRRLVLRLLRESIQTAGAKSVRLPGWRELGWSAETWTQAIRLLGHHVETQPGKGTYLVGEYPTLQDLYFAVGERRIPLSPTLPEGT